MLQAVLQRPGVRLLNTVFSKAGFEIRLVGGVVRDLLLRSERPAPPLPLSASPSTTTSTDSAAAKVQTHDVDLATDAPPQTSLELLHAANIRCVATGIQHGTVTAIVEHIPYEITSLRIDVNSINGRHAQVCPISLSIPLRTQLRTNN